MDSSHWGNFTPPVKQLCGETLGDLEPVYHLFMIMSEITLPLTATSAEHAPKSSQQNMPQKAVEKKEVLQNTEKKKLVLGFLHSVNLTGSPQDKSNIHSYLIPGQNNKSSKCKLKKKKCKKAAHNSRHNTINIKHNQHQYLHFTYLQLRKVWTGVFSFADHFSTMLKWSNHKYMSNSLLWHTTCLGANIYIPQALSYIRQLVITSVVTYTSHK